MKKILLIFMISLLCCGCGKQQEKIAFTCKQDAFASTYTATFDYVINSKDDKAVSSIESSSIYTASFDDTDFSKVIETLKAEKEQYEKSYTDTNIDLDDQKQQIYFRVMIPMNENNLSVFKEIDASLFENDGLSISKYKDFLTSQGYTCN